jgi:hypothetical protein
MRMAFGAFMNSSGVSWPRRNPISIAGRPMPGSANRYHAVVPFVVSTIGSHGLTTTSATSPLTQFVVT